MRSTILSLCVFFTLVGVAFAQGGAAGAPAGGVDGIFKDAFLDFSAGYMKPNGENSTWTGSASANMGYPLVRDWGLGWQIGAKVNMRDDEPDWLGGVGLFQREANIFGTDMTWGLQGFYVNTNYKADLAFVSGTLGTELDDTNYMAVKTIWGKNDDEAMFRVPWLSVQEGVNQAGALWGRRWDNNLTTELMGGYRFSAVDEPIVGLTLAWQLDNSWSLNVGGSASFAGDYTSSIGLGLDLDARGRNARLTNIGRKDPDDYTPLPLDDMGGVRVGLRKLWR